MYYVFLINIVKNKFFSLTDTRDMLRIMTDRSSSMNLMQIKNTNLQKQIAI